MKFISLLCALALLIIFNNNLASQDLKHCKTPEVNRQALEKHPEAVEGQKKMERFLQSYSGSTREQTFVYIIPVVFHIIHDNGPENISKAQVLDAIRVINEDFRKMNADTTIIITQFKQLADDMKIEFRLARIDPNGNCTDGIVRIKSDATYDAGDYVKQVSPSWGRDKYLNIWVVNSVEGAAGYSYYPGTVDGSSWGASRDGIVLCHDYLGSMGTSTGNKARTLTHEIGHYLNLGHPWGHTNDPGLPENCGMDDDVDDTPLTIGSDNCNLSQSSCGSLDNVQNYMEYSYCTRMFTIGQGERMRITLNSNVASRSNLWQESNLIATGTIDGYYDLCEPIAEFQEDWSKGCQLFKVQYTNTSYNTDLDSCTFLWEFEGGAPSSSTEMNPLITYPFSGIYDVSLTVSNSAGTDLYSKQSYINVVDTAQGIVPSFHEDFENSSFPLHPVQTDLDWEKINEGYANWERTEVASASGVASLRIANWQNDEGTDNILMTPNIDISGVDSILYVTFKIAYARKDVYSKDILQMRSSFDCGHTWSIKYYKQGSSSLITNGGDPVTSNFVPESYEWREETVDLSSFIGRNYVMLKFQCTSKGGNYLYLDDIRFIGDYNNLLVKEIPESKVNVFPNPSTGNAIIELNMNGRTSFCVTDISGKTIGYREFNLKENTQTQLSEIAPQMPAGIYFLSITNGSQAITKKITIVN